MKKPIIFIIYALLTLKINANVFFPDTVPEQEIAPLYSKQAIKGKQTLTFNAFDKQTYYIYVSTQDEQDGVIINLDSQLEYYTSPSEDLFYLYPNKDQGGVTGKKTLTIKAKRKTETYKTATLQLKTREYYLNIELIFSPYRSVANKFVYFQNANHDKNKLIYNHASYTALENKLHHSIKDRETLISRFLTNKAIFVPIHERISYDSSSMELSHLAIVNNLYMLTVIFTGEDRLSLNKNDIHLNIQPYRYSLATEIKEDIQSKPLKSSIAFENFDGKQAHTFLFNISKHEQKKRFFLELYLTQFNVFRKKINLDALKPLAEEQLFNVTVR
ncbi:hypothetical protein DID78_05810 [Candidatus Marinamargulisbacteria bacterium SCGC AG-343-D04]|nr:hypothetical protein DID78_05810 [Candidatus Marinamargulisbacteria bacterium SCGC AG-343-D04]